MKLDLFQTEEYRILIQQHLFQTIQYLFDQSQEFEVVCEVSFVDFNPELPSEIKDSFRKIVLFIISGYTFETAQLTEETFSFEAGFGNDNFGSKVSIPLLAIKQIAIKETPIVINFAQPVPEEEKKKEVSSKSTSMEALLKNPENQKLLKKKK